MASNNSQYLSVDIKESHLSMLGVGHGGGGGGEDIVVNNNCKVMDIVSN